MSFTLLWASGRGIFLLELTLVLTPFPQNSFGWEYKPRSSLFTHAFHCTASKDPDIHVQDWWMTATKTHPACTIHEHGMWLPLWVTQREKSPLLEKLSSGEDRTHNAASSRTASPTHNQWAIPAQFWLLNLTFLPCKKHRQLSWHKHTSPQSQTQTLPGYMISQSGGHYLSQLQHLKFSGWRQTRVNA